MHKNISRPTILRWFFNIPFTLLWIGYLIHKNNIVSPWNLYHLHNTTNYILLFIKRSLFSDRLFYYFALYPSFDLERVPSIYLFVQFSSLLIHTKSSIYNSVLVKEREITFASLLPGVPMNVCTFPGFADLKPTDILCAVSTQSHQAPALSINHILLSS